VIDPQMPAGTSAGICVQPLHCPFQCA
jgi:hypothetical protein